LPIAGADPDGTILGAMTGGQDAVLEHAWALSAWYGLASREPGYAASYLGSWSWPQVDLSSSRVVEAARVGRGLRAVWTPLDAGVGFTFTRLEWSAVVRLGWNGTFRDVLGVEGTATQPEELRTEDGFGSEVTLRAAWSSARRYVRSISPEEGRTLSLTAGVSAKELGSDYALLRARGAVTQYLRLPFTRHAVLALRVAGGAADGSLGTSAPFALGGPAQPDPASLLLGPAASPDQLRGYPLEWLEGTGFALANAELRFPIAAPERGYSTWPVFLRRIHGAVFADLGDAFDLPGTLPFAGHRFRWDELRLGAGAELRLELALGYALLTDLRLGVAHAFGRPFRGEAEEPGVAAVTGYAVLGGSF
ncbi:MAG TPA: BamA/TamA family outer membrane protein, partial [Anaeromyxobacter sp.]|nr:BamA/TamA family outer membrane protein [Anaeromyxobacter sp.]